MCGIRVLSVESRLGFGIVGVMTQTVILQSAHDDGHEDMWTTSSGLSLVWVVVLG